MRLRNLVAFGVAFLAAYQAATWIAAPLPVPEDVRTLVRLLVCVGGGCLLYNVILIPDRGGER